MQINSAKGIFTILAICLIIAGLINIINSLHPSEIRTHGIPQGLYPGIIYLSIGLGYILLFQKNRKSSKP
jgi:hypothetical protein